MRASDADRDRVAALLGDALATGRLTSVEHADRLDVAYTARTIGELVPLTRDLPAVSTPSSLPEAIEHQVISSKFSKMVRKGRWVASRHTKLTARFGALIIDLSDAVLPGREITIETDARFSKMIVRVPDNAHVIDEGSSIFGKRNVSGGSSEDGPLIRLTGTSKFSKVIVTRGKDDWNLH
ncbi:MAG: DUF1707 and DUF2154 domain-containing protein [Nonomuraea sp.]|nr:DUF1707 and DUF2154 domain-containing protein [Nonomuraea sp.]NUP66473.1 DUF1707 and DUF2154 domain-containing protein [Nonomuraea sp.]NUP79383.1 DUF1707 and DUF2154 domain-containing protein [Nonomuraea sp.]NUS05894.1 DUF1707 and DUF2154 domain-containing protein [Nonomuraea sp.]NUT45030.1 DUF1707 and DUF2154 domain-containing protein [Thermoactinospora sp.]